jgi:hypothetical protein
MKAVNLIKLRYLSEVVNQLEGQDFAEVTTIIEKQFKDIKSLDETDFQKVDVIFQRVREQMPEQSMVG